MLLVMVLVVSSMALEPGLTAREKQYVSECQAARYDIALLSAKVSAKPVVTGEAVTLVDLARALIRMTGMMETAAAETAVMRQQLAEQGRETARLRRQVAEMAAAAEAVATQASWFEWLGLFSVGRQPLLAFIFCVGGWEVATGWHRLKWLFLACLCQPHFSVVWTVMVFSVWVGRKGCNLSAILSACCLGGCPLWRRGTLAPDLLDLADPVEAGVGPVGAVVAALLAGNSAVAATTAPTGPTPAAATVAAGVAATVATAVVAVPTAVATVVQPRSIYRYVRGRSARLAAASSSSRVSETGF